MVKFLVQEIAQYTDIPFSFFGHSLGALAAFEVACALRALGWAVPEKIFVSDMEAPHVHSFLHQEEKVSAMEDNQLIAYLQGCGLPEAMPASEEAMDLYVFPFAFSLFFFFFFLCPFSVSVGHYVS